MGTCGYGMMGGWGWLGGLFSLLFLAVIVAGVILVVRQLGKPSSGTTTSVAGAQNILAERYARGEIDEQEYQQRLGVLRGQAKPRG